MKNLKGDKIMKQKFESSVGLEKLQLLERN